MTGQILVVDDIATNRMVMSAKLATQFFHVQLACNGAEALEMVRTAPPDLVLLDVNLPDTNGFALCRTIKADPATRSIPVVLVTAISGRGQLQQALDCGADDFLVKPVSDLSLFSRLRHLMRTRTMVDELRLRDGASEDLGIDLPAAPAAPVFDAMTAVTVGLGADARDLIADAVGCRVGADTGATTPPPADAYVLCQQGPADQAPFALAARLRADPATRSAGIIIGLARSDERLAARALEIGANDYLQADADPRLIALRLRNQLARKFYDDALRNTVRQGLRLAAVDPLTGLHNRRYALRHLGRIAEAAAETGKPFSLLMIDVDRFKAINDGYGHAAGDAVLRGIAGVLGENLRGVDMIARIGGEEFLVAMPDTPATAARAVAERLRRCLAAARHDIGDGHGIGATVSIGVAVSEGGKVDVQGLLDRADKALYAAKSDGRNQVNLGVAAA